ncbi:RNA polymerase sigma factor [Micromonospora sp. NPDC049559]|uniref:RNA polymerase sigma factor n=1 Tax=Micromonospora sp. NPDC049559 TaxID=3155923 RepID=UPI0034182ABC
MGGRPEADRAMGELYHASYRRLVAQVYAFTTDLNEAQDVVQEAFTRALARPRGLADVDNPEAWLRTVAVNVVRRRWRRRRLLDLILLRDRPVAHLVQPAPGPERADLRSAMAVLPTAYREVIVLHYFADLPVEEIAGLLGVPAGTVKSRLSRGRSALAVSLGDYLPDRPATDRPPGAAPDWPGVGPPGAAPARPGVGPAGAAPAAAPGNPEVRHA